jgi:hypothetical protein
MPEPEPIDPHRQPETPRAEPEILPPHDGRPRMRARVWTFEAGEGRARVLFAKPGPLSLILALLLIGFVAALVLILLLGLVVLWVPVLVVAVLIALLSGSLRRYWPRVGRG